MKRYVLVAVSAVIMTSCGGTTDPAVERGKALAIERGCTSCHTSDGSKGVGPTWKDLYMSRVELSDGRQVTADEAYLRRSIQDPSADTVKDFPAGTMERVIPKGSLDEEDVAALISYIKSLH